MGRNAIVLLQRQKVLRWLKLVLTHVELEVRRFAPVADHSDASRG